MVRVSKQDAVAAREAKLEEMTSRLEAAVEELTTGEDWCRAMTFAARFRSRSFGNTLLIFAQHAQAYDEGRVSEPFPTYVAGFKQWKQLGRSVNKGQSGYMIYAPITARFASATPQDPGSWRRLEPREKPRPNEAVRSKMINAKVAHVWDASQTSGRPIPERRMPQLLEGQAPDGLWDGLAECVAAAGFTISTVPSAAELGGANGVTDFTDRTVQVRTDMDDSAKVKCLAHELAHIALGHEDRGGEGLHRGIGEVEAESVAMMITAAYGMDSSGYSVPYMSIWSSTVEDAKPADVVRATGELARKTAMAILAELPEPPLGDGSPPGLDRRADLNHGVPSQTESAWAPQGVPPPRESSRPVVVEL